MSDQSIVAIIAVISSALVGLGTTFFNFLSQKAERDEKYRTMLFDKRLSVHQEGFKWISHLSEPIERARELAKPDGELPEGVSKHLATLYDEARTWWDQSCLYLDERSRQATFDFIEIAGTYVRSDRSFPSQDEMYAMRREAFRAVQEGIGQKYLDAGRSRSQTKP